MNDPLLDEDVAAFLNRTVTLDILGRKYSVPRTTVFEWLKARGARVYRTGRVSAKARAAKKLRAENKSFGEIAAVLGVTRQRAHQLVIEAAKGE